MNKRAINLICVFILLVLTQLACSFNDVLDNLGQGAAQAASPEVLSQVNQDSQIGNDQVETSYQESSHPAANQTECTKSFSASTTISDGQEFQAGDVIQAEITLLNTGSCTWDTGYSLIDMGGDLSPSSSSLVLSTEVPAGDSILLQVSYTAPSQSGPYLSIWKMQDADGGVFGQNNPPDAPLRIKIRVIPSGNPQPTPSPTPNPQAAEISSPCWKVSVLTSTTAGAAYIANLPDLDPQLPDLKIPTPLMIANGTLDPLVPWDGGVVGKDRGYVLSTRETVEWWTNNNHADPSQVQIAVLPDINPEDGCLIWREYFPPQAGGAPVLFYRFEGGGHTLPTLAEPGWFEKVASRLLGPVCHDVDGVLLAWDFFQESSELP